MIEQAVKRAKVMRRVALRASYRDVQGQAIALVSDSSRRRDPLRVMRLVLEELRHRVDYEFSAAIQAVVKAGRLAANEEIRSTLDAVQCQLENFARVHSALKTPEFRTRIDGGAYLQHLCEAISVSKLQFRGIQLEFVARDLNIDSEQCWRLGLILAQLVSNAARHSFLQLPARISVAAARRGALIWCQVEDNGMSSESEFGSRTLRIVAALVDELYGAFEQEQRGDHFVATVIFPATCKSDLDVLAAT